MRFCGLLDMKAELLIDSQCELGEGAVWDAARARLWWTDIDGRAIWRFDPKTELAETFKPPDRVGFLAHFASGKMLLGCAKALYVAEVAGTLLSAIKIVDVEADLRTTRLNDGRAD